MNYTIPNSFHKFTNYNRILLQINSPINCYTWGNLRERDHWGNLDVDGKIILRMDFRDVGGGGDWMDLAQDRDRWRALVNTVMNYRVP